MTFLSKNKSATTSQPKWPFKAIIVLLIITMVGFTPWERWFSIEISDKTLAGLSDGILGLTALFFLLCILLKPILRYDRWFSGLAILIIPIILFGIGLLLFIGWSMPVFNWEDDSVYQCDNDYLIVQHFNAFVTSSPVNPRVERTASPFALIRFIEERRPLADNDNKFHGDQVMYEGKKWFKIK